MNIQVSILPGTYNAEAFAGCRGLDNLVVMQGHLGLSSTVFLNLQTLRPINMENLRRGLFYVLDV